MTRGLIFWIILLLWFLVIIGGISGFLSGYGPMANTVLLFILFLLLGWQVYGPPVRGG
jgi:hypothetical protein